MFEVSQVLNQYPADCHPAQIEPLGFAGGMSGAQFWRITSRHRILCLRRWPTEHPSPQRLQFIHAILQHAARSRISFIPVPISTRDGASFVHHAGHLWQLEPWMPGAADYEQSPRVEKLRAAMAALAQFHIATSDFEPSAITIRGPSVDALRQVPSAIQRRLGQLRELSQRGANELLHAITDTIWPELAPLARQFLAAFPIAAQNVIEILEALSDVRLPLQPCLRDIWHDHILFTGDEVTGMIDFGAVDFDTPATDIARLLGSLVADDSDGWRTGLAAYSAVRPLSSDETLAVFALDKSGTVLAGCNWIRWIYVDGRQFEDRQQVIDRFRRIVQRVAQIK
jgi:Ser/Thr protein kinase RdoA (MazF antagonist)